MVFFFLKKKCVFNKIKRKRYKIPMISNKQILNYAAATSKTF